MKLFKSIVIVLLVLIIISGLVAYLLPSKTRIERSMNIKATREIVFEQVNNLRNWEKWSPWLRIDTAMELKYYGNEKGEGAGIEWKSDHRGVGCGNLTIFASKPYDSIYAEIDFLHKGKGITYYLLKNSETGTKVTWIFELNLGNNPFKRYVGLFMKKRIDRDFNHGLENLKKVSEDLSNLSQLAINESQFRPFTYIGIRDKIKPAEISEKMKVNFKELMDFVGKNKLKMTNAPFSIYYSFTKDEVDFEAGIPVENCKFSSGKIKVNLMKTSKVVVADFYGSYSGLGKEYEAIGKWIVENKKKVTGAPIEMYMTDPMNEKDTSKWLTKIYYPIE